jgi:exopolyphosphatase/guanosine-5'-triphosphate,3'-diphosphate pyrophosphatase
LNFYPSRRYYPYFWSLKFAAIDIGSNGVRLLIGRPLDLHSPTPEFKKVEFTRLPLRLGDDVFKDKEISKKKADLLLKSMKAFSLLMEIYNVDAYRACATSAMRDAKNSLQIIDKIKSKTGVHIEIIDGDTESKLITNSFLHEFATHKNIIHIDIGGGSTEISLIEHGKVKTNRSFNIGTVRLRENKVENEEWINMNFWIEKEILIHKPVMAIGTGGNMSKLYELSGLSNKNTMEYENLKKIVDNIKNLGQEDRIYKLKLNPDRAEVIDYAGELALHILRMTNVKQMYAPNKGLKDGIIQNLWQTHFNKQIS